MKKNLKGIFNKQHKNIAFTSQMEQNGSLSFLDIRISRENNKFVTSVESFISKCYKRSLIDTLLYRGRI